MSDTKEKIMLAALRLFAKDGYEAVSVSEIAAELSITKGALYKHYNNKRDIFNHIIERMSRLDFERAKEYDVPEGTFPEMEERYRKTQIEKLKIYSIEQFRYWTEDEFASLFRRMLTLEQYRSDEMMKYYQQYLSGGPVGYVADLLGTPDKKSESVRLALDFYAPMYLLMSMYDGAPDSDAMQKIFSDLKNHIDKFAENTAENLK